MVFVTIPENRFQKRGSEPNHGRSTLKNLLKKLNGLPRADDFPARMEIASSMANFTHGYVGWICC
jgi:hypothetical protein